MTIKNKESVLSRFTGKGDKQMNQTINKNLQSTTNTGFNQRDHRNKNHNQVSKENN